MKGRAQVIVWICGGVLGLTAAAVAAPVTVTCGLDFHATNQNLWGPGDSTDFGSRGSTPPPVGVDWNIWASAGRLDAEVRGDLSVSYEPVCEGTPSIQVDYQYLEGWYATRFGVGARLNGFVYVPIPVLPDINVRWLIFDSGGLLPEMNASGPIRPFEIWEIDSDTIDAIGVPIGIPGLVGVAAYVAITQRASLRLDWIEGTVTLTHEGTGRTVSAPLSRPIFDLDEPGTWHGSISHVALKNAFQQCFTCDLLVSLDYIVDSWEYSTGLPLYTTVPFEVAMAAAWAEPVAFDIEVVPEPATLALLAVGAAALRRRRAP